MQEQELKQKHNFVEHCQSQLEKDLMYKRVHSLMSDTFCHSYSMLCKTTACGCWVITPTVAVFIFLSCAQNHSIHSDIKQANFTIIHKQISTEVIQPISTRWNCEYPSAGVKSVTNNRNGSQSVFCSGLLVCVCGSFGIYLCSLILFSAVPNTS